MEKFIEGVIAILITIFLGFGVGCFLNWCVPQMKRLPEISENDWDRLFESISAGKPLGFFERLLILVSFWMQEYTIIAGWLAFKVAAKWQAWSDIVKVPDNMENIPQLVWYQARKRFGSWALSRFLIGTLINILICVLAVYVGKNLFKIVDWLCTLRTAA